MESAVDERWCAQCDRLFDGITVQRRTGYRCVDCARANENLQHYFAMLLKVKRGRSPSPVRYIAICAYCEKAFGVRWRGHRFCFVQCSAMSWIELVRKPKAAA